MTYCKNIVEEDQNKMSACFILLGRLVMGKPRRHTSVWTLAELTKSFITKQQREVTSRAVPVITFCQPVLVMEITAGLTVTDR